MNRTQLPLAENSNNSQRQEPTSMSSTASNIDCKLPSTPSNIYGAVTTSPATHLIYHKIENYYGVLVDGMTQFSGSYDACVDYINLMIVYE